ncbi:MAG TPA: Gfo/Idh/MocA family oxidoreductase [bacterium]|nr:Gfo/Idh/MocA family oxidoreductase [bacterium]
MPRAPDNSCESIKIGIVGYGIRGQKMARLSRLNFPENRITAICDHSEKVLKKAENDFPNCKTYPNFDKMLAESKIDALFVETPAPYHAEFSIKALQRNIHVLSDVPAVDTISEANQLWQTHLKSSAIFMLQSTTNMFGYIEKIKQLQNKGKIGDPYYIEAEYIHDLRDLFGSTPWREKYENIKYCTHSLGPSLDVLEQPFVRVSCFDTGSHVNQEKGQHDAMVAIFQTAQGQVAKLLISFINHCPAHGQRYRFYFTDGYFERTADYNGKYSGKSYYYSEVEHSDKKLHDLGIGEGLPKNANKDNIGNHGGANFELLKRFYSAIEKEDQSPLSLKKSLQMTIPGIYAAKSARQKGKNITIQYPWD